MCVSFDIFVEPYFRGSRVIIEKCVTELINITVSLAVSLIIVTISAYYRTFIASLLVFDCVCFYSCLIYNPLTQFEHK